MPGSPSPTPSNSGGIDNGQGGNGDDNGNLVEEEEGSDNDTTMAVLAAVVTCIVFACAAVLYRLYVKEDGWMKEGGDIVEFEERKDTSLTINSGNTVKTNFHLQASVDPMDKYNSDSFMHLESGDLPDSIKSWTPSSKSKKGFGGASLNSMNKFETPMPDQSPSTRPPSETIHDGRENARLQQVSKMDDRPKCDRTDTMMTVGAPNSVRTPARFPLNKPNLQSGTQYAKRIPKAT